MPATEHLDGCLTTRIAQAHVEEIELQHTHERVEHRANNVGRIATTPDRRQSKQGDQIIDTALQAPDLLGMRFKL